LGWTTVRQVAAGARESRFPRSRRALEGLRASPQPKVPPGLVGVLDPARASTGDSAPV